MSTARQSGCDVQFVVDEDAEINFLVAAKERAEPRSGVTTQPHFDLSTPPSHDGTVSIIGAIG